jgi:hypothetical protein
MASHARWILILALLAISFVPARGQFAFPNTAPAATSGPHLDFDWAEQRAFRQQLRELAGKDAVDCGLARVNQDPSSQTDCALEAFAARKPFYVLYGALAFIAFTARTPDGILMLNYYGHYPLWWRMGWFAKQTTPRPDFTSTLCPTPVTLRKTPQGDLTCFAFPPVVAPGQSLGTEFWFFPAPAVIK